MATAHDQYDKTQRVLFTHTVAGGHNSEDPIIYVVADNSAVQSHNNTRLLFQLALLE